MRVLLIGVFIFVLCFQLSINAQRKSKVSKNISKITSTDVRIDKDKPHIFISFEDTKKIEPLHDGESEYRVFLRFNNNSVWKVSFCIGATPPEYGEFEVIYEIFRVKGIEQVPPSGGSHNCQGILVNPKSSILFSVPKEHLADDLAIKIAFRYQWQEDSDGAFDVSETKNYCYFYSTDLPNNRN